jgi:hypothetical protein
MKFNIKISKWGAFYFFVSNLSEWHFSNRKDYNVFWKEMLGTFSVQEEDTLKKFKEIRLKYPQSKSCFEKAFFLSKNPFEELTHILPEEEYIIVKDVFSLLESKFNFLYEKGLPFLIHWQKVLDKTINDQKLTNTILNHLNILYKTSIQEGEIDIYLLFSTVTHTGGGANIDNKSISVEISHYPLENINHILGLVWHETTHLIFQNQYFRPLLIKLFPNNQQKVDLINEMVIRSLFPRGMLGIRLLKNKPVAKLLPDIGAKQTIEILNLTKEYLDKNESFDENYIEKLSLVIKRA